MDKKLNKPLTVNQAIAYIKDIYNEDVSSQTIRYWCNTKGIAKKFGGQWRIDKSLLNEFINK